MVETPKNGNISPNFGASWELLSSYIIASCFPQKKRLKEHFPRENKLNRLVSQSKSHYYLTAKFLLFPNPVFAQPPEMTAPLHLGGKYTLAPLRNAFTGNLRGPRPPQCHVSPRFIAGLFDPGIRDNDGLTNSLILTKNFLTGFYCGIGRGGQRAGPKNRCELLFRVTYRDMQQKNGRFPHLSVRTFSTCCAPQSFQLGIEPSSL